MVMANEYENVVMLGLWLMTTLMVPFKLHGGQHDLIPKGEYDQICSLSGIVILIRF